MSRVVWALCFVVLALTPPATAETATEDFARIFDSATEGTCQPSASTLCLHDHRFAVELDFEDSQGGAGAGRKVESQSADSGLFWFYRQENWEMLVKVLDGCGVNGHFWVFAAGTTDVGYELRVRDTVTGRGAVYRNPVGRASAAITDAEALPVCDGPARGPAVAAEPVRIRPVGAAEEAIAPYAVYDTAEICLTDEDTLCLNRGRFRVRVEWQDFQGGTGDGQVVPLSSADSGLFWFFHPNNWEMLVKALDGCGVNGHYWVFAAATTNVGYVLQVTDTMTGANRTYVNPVGRSAPPTLDVSAFSCNDVGDGLPPDPGPANDETLAGIDSDADGLRDDVQRYIALNYGDEPGMAAGLRQAAMAQQVAVVEDGRAPVQAGGDLVRAAECLRAMDPDTDRLEAALLAEVLDTEARLRAYLAFNDALGGEAFPSRPPGEWSDSCGFDPANPSQVRAASVIRVPASACIGADTAVYFANGMLNSFEDARSSLLTLRLALGQSLPGNTFFALAFNPSDGALVDLWEAVQQELNSDTSRFYRILGGIDLMPDFIQDALLDIAAGLDRDAVAASPAATAHLNLYQSEVLEGKKVVVVAHSQGNFFTNLVYGALEPLEQQSVGVVAVATPANFVAGGGPHVTLREDLIIGALILRRPLNGPKTPNTTNGEVSGDLLGHSFSQAYMYPGATSRSKILTRIDEVNRSLVEPVPLAEEGVITVTLTWGDEPDVDLHVYEPNGTHVYYANRRGQSGYLDVDDVNGRGPEHYYVSCEDLETGTYRVGVNYYHGFGPETALVQVRAGLEVQTFRQTLVQDRGSSGNQSPILLSNVLVSGSQEEGFDFFVRSAQ